MNGPKCSSKSAGPPIVLFCAQFDDLLIISKAIFQPLCIRMRSVVPAAV